MRLERNRSTDWGVIFKQTGYEAVAMDHICVSVKLEMCVFEKLNVVEMAIPHHYQKDRLLLLFLQWVDLHLL